MVRNRILYSHARQLVPASKRSNACQAAKVSLLHDVLRGGGVTHYAPGHAKQLVEVDERLGFEPARRESATQRLYALEGRLLFPFDSKDFAMGEVFLAQCLRP